MPFDSADQELRLEALEKIGRVIELLAAKGRWCKGRLRTEDGRMCILGAVREADAELVLYAPILRAIREVTGQGYRQIETFNDGWLATHNLVLAVLERARDNLARGVLFGRHPPGERSQASGSRRFSLLAHWRRRFP